jgi:hypothetical protein
MTQASPPRPEVDWPGTYTDQVGRESIVFANDGTELRTTIRGVEFVGSTPEMLWPTDAAALEGRVDLRLRNGTLWRCLITIEMPVVVVIDNQEVSGVVHLSHNLGHTAPASLAVPRLVLIHEGTPLEADAGRDSEFESALPRIEKQLPPGAFFKTCINCQYSDYSPGGSQEFGSLMCFRKMKSEYLAATTKNEWFTLGERAERTQETFLCQEFVRRRPGTGYRG